MTDAVRTEYKRTLENQGGHYKPVWRRALEKAARRYNPPLSEDSINKMTNDQIAQWLGERMKKSEKPVQMKLGETE